jgi:histidine triad (HIT) family protein
MKKDDCIFCKIAAGEIPSRKVYEDDEVFAFHDIQPVAPVHFLMIPRDHVASLADCGPEHAAVLGRMMAMAGRLAREQGAADGFRTIVNTGRVGRQDVYHLHIHIIGGPDRLPRMIAAE